MGSTSEIAPIELLKQLRDIVSQLSWSADDQYAYLRRSRLDPPVDDMYVQLEMAVPDWFPRLEQHGLIDEATEMRLLALSAMLGDMEAVDRLWGPDSLNEPEWERVRAAAREVLAAIDAGIATAES
jgi:hypothetical protein